MCRGIAQLAVRRRREFGCAGNIRHHGRHTMTAPLKRSDPITVDVALGERAYDIVICRDVLQSLGAGSRVAARRAYRRSSPTAMLQKNIARENRSVVRSRRCRIANHYRRSEGSKTYAGLEQVSEALIAARSSATIWWSRSAAAWSAISPAFAAAILRPAFDFVQVPDFAAGAGRLVRRRQKRGSIRRAEKTFSARFISRFLWSRTPPYSTRCRRDQFAPASRSRQIRRARRRSVLCLAGDQPAIFSPAARRANTPSPPLCRAKAAIVARDEARNRERRCSIIGHTFRPRAGGRDRLFRPAVPWRRRCRRHGAGRRKFSRNSG